MYEAFYNITTKPFQISTDHRFLWLGEKHKEALANLKYGLYDRNGFIVLTGDVGTGKTTLVNALVDALGENVHVVRINHPSLNTHEFLTLVAKTLDPGATVANKSDFLLFINDYLQQAHSDSKIVLLIIDEAHRLSIDLLEEIRLLSNIEREGERLLGIIFAGQNEINSMLLAPQCRALYQRITSFYNIPALSLKETQQYIDYRLKVSGARKKVFTPGATGLIYALSGGIPRVINILCDRAMLTGYVKDRKVIDLDIIAECGHELDLTVGEKKGRQKRLAWQAFGWWPGCVVKMKAFMASSNKTLRKVLQWLNSNRDAMVRKIRTAADAFINTLQVITRHFKEEKQKRIRKLLLPVGIAIMVIAVTLGLFSNTEDSGALPISDYQPGKIDLAMEAAGNKDISFGQSIWNGDLTQSYLGEALPSDPSENDWEFLISSVLSMKEDSALVPEATSFTTVYTHVEEAKAALEQGHFQKAIDLLEAVPVGAANEDIEAVDLYAKALIGRADEIMETSPLKAEALLGKASEVAPKMIKPHLMLAKRYTHTKEYPRAIEAYQKVVQLDPAESDAFFNLGFIYATNGKYEEAENAFKQVVQLKPAYLTKSLFNLAVVQQRLGKNRESIANLEAVVAMEPDNQKALDFLNRLRKSSNTVKAE